MVETQGRLTEEQQRRHVETSHARGHDSGALDNGPGKLSHTLGLVSHESLSARANTTTRATTLGAMQQTYGNRAVQRYLHAAVPTSSRPTSISVQREEEGGIWDWTKKLIGVDQIGPSIEKAAGKAKSGYNWTDKKLFNLLGGG